MATTPEQIIYTTNGCQKTTNSSIITTNSSGVYWHNGKQTKYLCGITN